MKKKFLILSALALFSVVSCDNGNDNKGDDNGGTNGDGKYFNVVWCASDEGETPSYAQALTDISSGDIDGSKGFETPSVRSAYTFTSSDGAYLYNYNYGGGTFDKYEVKGGANYVSVGVQLSLTNAIGSAYGRCSYLTDELASAHNVVTEPQYENGVYTYTKSELKLAIIDLTNVVIKEYKTIEIPRTAYDIAENKYVWRVHMPYIHNGKIYYGLGQTKALASDPTKRDSSVKGHAGFLVMDYPSFANPKIVRTTIDTEGDTYGFRSRPIYPYGGTGANKDDLYQLSMTNSHILKITNGEYDNNYVFSLKEALGSEYEISSAGWHYVGNGIGYVPFREEKGDEGNNWGLARVDLNTKTAIRLNIPSNMDMWEYQSARLEGTTLYMAICPVDGSGHVYMFDTTSTSADGFTKGAVLKGSADAYYAGVF